MPSTAYKLTDAQIRKGLYKKINAIWNQLRPELAGDERREAKLDFAAQELRLPPLGSLTECTTGQLRRLAEVLEREQRQPRLAGTGNRLQAQPQPVDQVVEHLASAAQVIAIERLKVYLGWSDFGFENFLKSRFRHHSPRMLTKRQADSAIVILLNCAGSKYWKREGKSQSFAEYDSLGNTANQTTT